MCCSSKDAFKGVCGGGRIHTAQTATCIIQPWSWAAGGKCTVCSSPGDNESKRRKKKTNGGKTWQEKDARTMTSIMANTWMGTRRGEVVQGRRGRTEILYAVFSSWILFWNVCHICQRSAPDSLWCTPAHVAFTGAGLVIVQRAALPLSFLF